MTGYPVPTTHGKSMILGANGLPMDRFREGHTAYEGGRHGRRTRGWLAPGTGPNDSATGNSQTLRNRSRQQHRDNPWAKAGINRLASNIIGTGIRPRWDTGDKELDRRAQTMFKESSSEFDPEGLLDFYGQQNQGVVTWLSGGELFVRIRARRKADGLRVPIQFQFLESEMCPQWHTGSNGGNPIRNGIEYDRVGRRMAYWFYKSHPGEFHQTAQDSGKLTRVPARDVIHMFDPIRPGQTRGVIAMAPVLMRLYSLDKLEDAVLLRQEIANLFAGFITRKVSDDDLDEGAGPYNPITGEAAEDNGDLPAIGLEPGLMQELDDDEDIKFSQPPDAGNNYGDFLRLGLMGVAAGMEVPYEVLTGDFSQINDRTARVLLNEFRRRIQQMQRHIVVHQLCRRIGERWTDAAVMAGVLPAPGYAQSRSRFVTIKWVPQAWRYTHPVQDVDSDEKAKRSGFKTQQQIISETTGEDIDDVYDQLQKENQMADERGLIFDTDPRHTDGSGKSRQSKDSDDGDDNADDQ